MISRGSLLHTRMILTVRDVAHPPIREGSFFIALSDSYVESGVEMVDIMLNANPTGIATYVFDVISEG